MSSLGGQWRQWRALRHYLSLGRLQVQLNKLVQRVRPATPDQWNDLIDKFKKAISSRVLASNVKEIENPRGSGSGSTATPTAPTAEDEQRPEKAEQTAQKWSEVGLGSGLGELSLRGLLRGLRLKRALRLGKLRDLPEPGWKDNRPVVDKPSVQSRTAYVVSALAAARSGEARSRRARDLVRHLLEHREARQHAVRAGAVRTLLRVRERAGPELRGIAREALALLAVAAPPRGRGPRVLALDGGGVRGLVAIELLRELERLAGRPARALFDYVIGVSTGAIIAAVVGGGARSLEAAAELYVSLSRQMFASTGRVGGASRLVLTHSYYDTAAWERLLRDHIGDRTLSSCNRLEGPHLALVSCVVSGATPRPFLFRSYGGGSASGTASGALWHAVRASAAAPTYFAEFQLDGLVHQDGGIARNNPCGVGVREARRLFGAAEMARATVVSLGCGRGPPAAASPAAASTSWRDKFYAILDSATDTEGVHELLAELLPAGQYFRLNPPLLAPCSMDETDEAKIAALLEDTARYIRRNRHKLRAVAARLAAPRPLLRRAADFCRRQAVMRGLCDP